MGIIRFLSQSTYTPPPPQQFCSIYKSKPGNSTFQVLQKKISQFADLKYTK